MDSLLPMIGKYSRVLHAPRGRPIATDILHLIERPSILSSQDLLLIKHSQRISRAVSISIPTAIEMFQNLLNHLQQAIRDSQHLTDGTSTSPTMQHEITFDAEDVRILTENGYLRRTDRGTYQMKRLLAYHICDLEEETCTVCAPVEYTALERSVGRRMYTLLDNNPDKCCMFFENERPEQDWIEIPVMLVTPAVLSWLFLQPPKIDFLMDFWTHLPLLDRTQVPLGVFNLVQKIFDGHLELMDKIEESPTRGNGNETPTNREQGLRIIHDAFKLPREATRSCIEEIAHKAGLRWDALMYISHLSRRRSAQRRAIEKRNAEIRSRAAYARFFQPDMEAKLGHHVYARPM